MIIGIILLGLGIIMCAFGLFERDKFWHFLCGLFVWMGLLIIALSSFFILVYGA